MLKHITKKAAAAFGSLFLLILVIMLWHFAVRDWMLKERDIRRFAGKEYEGAFLGTYDLSDFKEEDFITYRGIPVFIADYTLKDWKDISDYLSRIFSSGSEVTHIYLGMDPEVLWVESGRAEERWTEDFEKYLMPYLRDRQDVAYEFLLPAPSLQYWVDIDPVVLQENLAAYSRFIADADPYANVTVYFMGGAQWLNANPGNYQNVFLPTPLILKKMFLYTFCDREFQIEESNAAEILSGLQRQIEQEKTSPVIYPDLSQWCMIFIGDSVVAYNVGSSSWPGVVEGLSGAQVYNCGQGGVAASQASGAQWSFVQMVTCFLEQDVSGLPEDCNFSNGLAKYVKEEHRGKKYCFVLNYGFNDYINGYMPDDPDDPYDIETYAGALRTGIRMLQERFPDAVILVTTPTYMMSFESEIEEQGKKANMLTDYVDAAVRVSEEMGVCILNNYEKSGITEENWNQYLADGVHPNESGAFLLAERIIDKMEEIIAEGSPVQ